MIKIFNNINSKTLLGVAALVVTLSWGVCGSALPAGIGIMSAEKEAATMREHMEQMQTDFQSFEAFRQTETSPTFITNSRDGYTFVPATEESSIRGLVSTPEPSMLETTSLSAEDFQGFTDPVFPASETSSLEGGVKGLDDATVSFENNKQ